MAEKEVVLLPAGTVLQAGEPPPPTKSNKAAQAGYWAALPIFMGAVVEGFRSFGNFYPDAPDGVLRAIAYALQVLGPIAAYFGVNRGRDQLQQPVETIEGTSLDGRHITVIMDTPVADIPPGPAAEVSLEDRPVAPLIVPPEVDPPGQHAAPEPPQGSIQSPPPDGELQ
jgi:hypothetical protein